MLERGRVDRSRHSCLFAFCRARYCLAAEALAAFFCSFVTCFKGLPTFRFSTVAMLTSFFAVEGKSCLVNRFI